MKKLLFILIIVFVIFSLGIQMYLPMTIEKGIKNSLLNTYPLSKDVEVKVTPGIGLNILNGNIESLSIKAKKIYFNELPLDDVDLSLEKLRFDTSELLNRKRFVLKDIAEGNIKLNLSEAALNQQVSSQPMYGINNAKIILDKDIVQVKGQLKLLAGYIDASCFGMLEPGNGAQLIFKPVDLSLGGYAIPETLKNKLLGQISFKVSLTNFTLPIDIKKVKVLDGAILVEGKVALME